MTAREMRAGRAVSRDPAKLRVYHESHALVLSVFRHCGDFPREQRYIISQQLQRAALSTVCNLVEGCSRRSASEYRQFVNIALGSAREAAYLIDLSAELSYLPQPIADDCRKRCKRVVGSLQNLLRALEGFEG
jgi:four helix bundle protein